jgi:hypothetical protein
MSHTAFVIAFNAALTLEACLRNIVPMFDRVIVVEGAVCNDPRVFGVEQFTTTGHSTDETLAIIKSFPTVKLVQTQATFFHDKTQMCNHAAALAPDGWLWQVDADEFFHADDILRLKGLLEYRWQGAEAVEFRAFHFWGDKEHITDPTKTVWGNLEGWRRIFKAPVEFVSHEPPRGSREGRVISRDETSAEGIFLYHYGYIYRRQAEVKSIMYQSPQTLEAWDAWQKDHTLPAYADTPVVEFIGEHPV